MQLNWTIISYIVIGLLAISGYQRGWWKEAVTTFFLVFLVVLLTIPDFAQFLIETINEVVAIIWDLFPQGVKDFLSNLFENWLGLDTGDGLFQFNSGDGSAWLLLLIVVLGLSVIIGRLGLFDGIRQGRPYSVYVTTPLGRILGGLLGGINALILLDLVREYLDGRFLPPSFFTELAMTGSPQVQQTAPGAVAARVTDIPTFTFLDSPWAWILIGLSLILLIVVFRSRRLPRNEAPFGYKKWEVKNGTITLVSTPTSTWTSVRRWVRLGR
ncbi:MAG TPA: hypothetical protein PKE64_02235 [Anaerolineae bacterium]|nr:hypothetical protein [Anaerolineae bacterium]HMR62806.1 hypothetical protein [Anaerolineae bacterium]